MPNEEKIESTSVFITRYALSSGIIKVSGTLYLEAGKSKMMHVPPTKPEHIQGYYHGEDIQLDLESAQKRAEEMRKKKLASMRKQLEKLEKMQIKVKDQTVGTPVAA